VKGKKLTKIVSEEGDDAPIRQGISFDAFKLPEVPEEEGSLLVLLRFWDFNL